MNDAMHRDNDVLFSGLQITTRMTGKHETNACFRLRNLPSLMVLNMLSTPVEGVAREFDGMAGGWRKGCCMSPVD